MANNDDQRGRPAQQPFTLYAAKNGRLYARNRDQKVIDLGAIAAEDGRFGWLLDGNQERGTGFFTEEEALRDLARNLCFLWLDGQFTAVADAREGDLDLDGAARLDITLDELQPGERAYDATV